MCDLKGDKYEGISKILVTEEEIKSIVKKLAEQISNDYKGKKLLIIGVLKGSVIFMADLIREIDIDSHIDFMSVSSYGNGIKSSGRIKIEKDLSIDVSGYDVLIAEDILDSGRSLSKIIELLKGRNPSSLEVCALFSKPLRREVDINAKYIGLEVPDEFIVGYGLDYAEKYRSLPFIGTLDPRVINNN